MIALNIHSKTNLKMRRVDITNLLTKFFFCPHNDETCVQRCLVTEFRSWYIRRPRFTPSASFSLPRWQTDLRTDLQSRWRKTVVLVHQTCTRGLWEVGGKEETTTLAHWQHRLIKGYMGRSSISGERSSQLIKK